MSAAALEWSPGATGSPTEATVGREAARWSVAFALVLGLHVAGIAVLLAARNLVAETGEALPAVTVDLAPPPAAPTVAPADAPPRESVPAMTAPDPTVEAPPDTSVPDMAQPPPVLKAEIPPDPPPVQRDAAVSLPPPVAKTPPKPRPVERVESKPPRPAPARRGERVEERRPPVQAAGAPSAAAAVSSSSGSAAASRASWQGTLVAHLRRFLQPQNGQTGSASVRFTMTRGGAVTATALVGSAGSPALDAEALAVFRRSQPLPAAPPDVPGQSFTFTIPVRFTAR